MLRLSLFASRQFTAINATTVLFYGGLSAAGYLLVIQLQLQLGYSAVQAGAVLIPQAALFLVISPLSGGLVARVGPRRLMVAGILTVAAAFLWLSGAHAGASYALAILPAAILWGVGVGLAVTPLTAAVLAAVDDRDLGEASAINDAASRLGAVVAIAVVPALIGVGGGATLGARAGGRLPAGHDRDRRDVRRGRGHRRVVRVRRPHRRAAAGGAGAVPRLRAARLPHALSNRGIVTTAAVAGTTQRAPRLPGQTVVIIGGSAGIGLETARQARAEGAEVVLTGRDPERLRHAGLEVGARSSAAFDAADPAALERFFRALDDPVDHVMVSAGGMYYAPVASMDFAQARRALDEHLWLTLQVAREAPARVRPGGTLLFMTGTVARHAGAGLAIASAVAGALPAVTADLALELAPIRVNLIAAGFVDTPLSAALLGDQLDARRDELRATLPIGRVVGPADVAALAIHLMTNTALTGATYDIDGGQQLISSAT